MCPFENRGLFRFTIFLNLEMHQGKDWTILNTPVKVSSRVDLKFASTAVNSVEISNTLHRKRWQIPVLVTGGFRKTHSLIHGCCLQATCQALQLCMRSVDHQPIISQSQSMEVNWIVKHCEVFCKHQLIVGSLIESKLAANQTCAAQRRAANSTSAKQQKPDT